MADTFGENFEQIDNEKQNINETLEKKEDLVALGTLNAIDIQIPNIDIDLAVDRKSNKYYFIANINKSSKESLNIGFNLNKLPEIGAVMVKLFNNDIQLFGGLDSGRSIAKDTLWPDGFEEKFISDGTLSKNEIEKIFIFVMKSKGIKIEDWKLESSVCIGGVNNACKQALGN